MLSREQLSQEFYALTAKLLEVFQEEDRTPNHCIGARVNVTTHRKFWWDKNEMKDVALSGWDLTVNHDGTFGILEDGSVFTLAELTLRNPFTGRVLRQSENVRRVVPSDMDIDDLQRFVANLRFVVQHAHKKFIPR